MSTTQPVDWIGKFCDGYIINAAFNDENTAKITSLITELQSRYGGAIYSTPTESLHITLLDWIAPLVDYDGQDKRSLFNKIYDSYDQTLSNILADEPAFEVVFDEISVGPTTIFIRGHDDGAFERIRNKFLNGIELIPGTKLPPTIIHSSLARFIDEIDFAEVESFVSTLDIRFTQKIESFRLLHTKKEPMQEFELLKEYRLGSQ